jgi:hypothetical protein
MGSGLPAVIKIDRMTAVQVAAPRNEGRLGIPQSSLVVLCGETKDIRVLAEPIQVGRCWELGTELKELCLEDEWCRRGVEEKLARF